MKKNSCNIGGQAVLEGVMMRGTTSMATSVRTESGDIVTETTRVSGNTAWYKKVPILRGIINFIQMLIMGTGITMRAAKVFEYEDLSTVSQDDKVDGYDIATTIGLILGIAIAIFLFVWLPEFVRTGISNLFGWSTTTIWSNLFAGAIRMVVFILYMVAISLLKDMRRLFMYHGAEHKTIACYEAGLPLTPDNAIKCSRIHDRCGTTFLFIVMVVSVLLFSVFTIENMAYRFLVRLALVPVVAGISYEILKFLARHDGVIIRIIKWPGLQLQYLTTREPTIDMLEVAIASFNAVLQMDSDSSIPTRSFDDQVSFKVVSDEVKRILKDIPCGDVDGEWILSRALGCKRSELGLEKYCSYKSVKQAIRYARDRAKGRPLQYVLGDTDFFGVSILVDERVLIPRLDTEILAEQTAKVMTKDKTLLDMCTGSGAIGISVSKQTGCKVTLADISQDALSLAKTNAERLGVGATIVQTDMFSNINQIYDVIVCNPPYIPHGDIDGLDAEVKREPLLALDGGADGLDYYRTIARDSAKYLVDRGVLLLEVGVDEAEQVSDLLKDNFDTEIIKDLCGIDRIVKGVKCSRT